MRGMRLFLILSFFLRLYGFSAPENSYTYHAEGKGGAVAAEDPAAVAAGMEIL